MAMTSSLVVLRAVIRTAIDCIARMRQQPPLIELSEDELQERAKREHMQGRRAARVPWYHHRPGQVQIPDSLKYYEAVHGTKAMVEMLKERARQLENAG